MDLGLKLRIAFCKNIASGFKREAVWIGEALSWTKKRGRARSSLPYFKVMFGDLMEKTGMRKIKKLKKNWINGKINHVAIGPGY